MREDFAAFILTHGRADNVVTYQTLRKDGYTGKVFFIVDNEDDQVDLYRKNFGAENVIVFDKLEEMEDCDEMDNFRKHGVILYARNVSFKIAKRLGLKYFLELDDDYVSFMFRFIKDGKLIGYDCKNLDRVFEDALDFLVNTDSMVVALSQGGDYIGGINGTYYYKGLSRKAMNSFFCRTDRPFKFVGTLNEDVNMYTTEGSRGKKIFSFTQICLVQKASQSQAQGMTETYLDVGTYVKSFYTVMTMPSAVKVAMMGAGHSRMHHNVDWNKCVPLILNEKWKKKRKGARK